MKSLAKILFNSDFGINIRNKIGFKPLQVNFSNIKENVSVSDAFIWRTDNNFKTIFKFTDLLKLFYKINNSSLDFYFYDNNYNLIKNLTLNEINLSNEIIIDNKFLNNYEGLGIFFIFHKDKNIILVNQLILSNRCYLGFSYNNNLPSFVHGNTYAISENINNNKKTNNFIGRSLFCKQNYRIQNNFNDHYKSELVIVNPTTKKIKFYLNDKKYFLNGLNTSLLNIGKTQQILIKSNCYFLRPIAFSYKKEFIDVYHL